MAAERGDGPGITAAPALRINVCTKKTLRQGHKTGVSGIDAVVSEGKRSSFARARLRGGIGEANDNGYSSLTVTACMAQRKQDEPARDSSTRVFERCSVRQPMRKSGQAKRANLSKPSRHGLRCQRLKTQWGQRQRKLDSYVCDPRPENGFSKREANESKFRSRLLSQHHDWFQSTP